MTSPADSPIDGSSPVARSITVRRFPQSREVFSSRALMALTDAPDGYLSSPGYYPHISPRTLSRFHDACALGIADPAMRPKIEYLHALLYSELINMVTDRNGWIHGDILTARIGDREINLDGAIFTFEKTWWQIGLNLDGQHIPLDPVLQAWLLQQCISRKDKLLISFLFR